MFRNGDIVYLKEPYSYKLRSGDIIVVGVDIGYIVSNYSKITCLITNPATNCQHFMFKSNGSYDLLINKEEYRNRKINEILKNVQ